MRPPLGPLIRVYLIDDHPIVREGLSAILIDEPDIDIVGQTSNAEEGLVEIAELRPDVVVVDVRLPGMSGIEACATLQPDHELVRTIVLTSFPTEEVMLAALTAGARGFLVKESDPVLLRSAVRTVHSGGLVIDPRMAGRLVALATRSGRAKGPFDLTTQEMRVIALLPQGLTNRQIAGQMCLSEATIKTHLVNAMRKLDIHDRAQAASFAVREGLA